LIDWLAGFEYDPLTASGSTHSNRRIAGGLVHQKAGGHRVAGQKSVILLLNASKIGKNCRNITKLCGPI